MKRYFQYRLYTFRICYGEIGIVSGVRLNRYNEREHLLYSASYFVSFPSIEESRLAPKFLGAMLHERMDAYLSISLWLLS